MKFSPSNCFLGPGSYCIAFSISRIPLTSLNNPEGCDFVFKDHGKVPFEDQGSAFLMDISNVHSVWNRSDTPRIHMIIHYELGRRIRDFFYVLRQSYFTNRG